MRRIVSCLLLAVAVGLPAHADVALPAQALAGQALTEPTVGEQTLTGTVDEVAVDGRLAFGFGEPVSRPAPAAAKTLAFVRSGTRLVSLPPALQSQVRRGERVAVTLRRGGAVRVLGLGPAAARLGATGLAGATAASGVTGRHTLTVLPVHVGTTDGQTVSTLTTLAQQTAQYWSEQSGGAITVTTSVRAWHAVADTASCDPATLATEALAANGLTAPTSPSDHVLIYFPTRNDCAWAGLGSVGGSMIWDNGYPITDVTAHEFGHNLGLGHANTARCTTGAGGTGTAVPLSANCQVDEYGDGADVMGYARLGVSTGSLNTALADSLGLVQSVTASPTATTLVSLSPLAQVSAMRAVKIPLASGTVFVDLRPANGRDTREAGWAGVQVHLRPNGGTPTSQLLDLQPASFTHPQLPAHLVWPVPGTGLGVVVNNLGATAAISVTPISGDVAAPTAPQAEATTSIAAGGSTEVHVTWAAVTDAGSGVAAYAVYGGADLLGRTGPEATTLDAPLPLGATTVRVDAIDHAGNVSTGATVAPDAGGGSVPPAGHQPPGRVTLIRPTAALVQRGHQLQLNWAPATAATGVVVAYRISVDGVPLGTTGGTSVVVTGLPEGVSRVGVAAVDDAGGVGPASRVMVTVDSIAPRNPGKPLLAKGTLSWLAPADHGSALRYRIYRDGALLATVAATSARVRTPMGRHTWAVRAVDAAGNLSGQVGITVRIG